VTSIDALTPSIREALSPICAGTLTRRRCDRPPPKPLRQDVSATPRRIFRVDKVTHTSSAGVWRDVVGTSYVTETLTGLEHQERDIT